MPLHIQASGYFDTRGQFSLAASPFNVTEMSPPVRHTFPGSSVALDITELGLCEQGVFLRELHNQGTKGFIERKGTALSLELTTLSDSLLQNWKGHKWEQGLKKCQGADLEACSRFREGVEVWAVMSLWEVCTTALAL